MNSRETLTCNLLHLPQDIFRVIFQYLSVEDLMDGEEAFLHNQELLSLYRSSLEGFTLKETVTNEKEEEEDDDEDQEEDEDKYKELVSWIIDRKLLVETLELYYLSDLEINLLNHVRSSLKSISFISLFCFPSLGHFPSLTSVTFSTSMLLTNDKLLSFFSQSPQLEFVKIENMHSLSNEILSHLSDYCPKIKILSLSSNWVNDKTISLLAQQRLFPNLKSLNMFLPSVRNQESLRQFILSHPLLSSISLSSHIQYSDDFLVFYLRQVIFPSILSQNNNKNHESRSLAIFSLWGCFGGRIFDGRNNVVNPEIFSVDILSHFSHKDCLLEALEETAEIFSYLSKFPSMIDSILQSQFIPFILNDTRPHDYLLIGDLVDILFRCGIFHDYLPLLVEKYQTHPSSLIQVFHHATKNYFSLLTTEELQIMIPIVLTELSDKGSTLPCLKIISKLLQEPSSQHLIDSNNLLLSFKTADFSNYNGKRMFEFLERFISLNENYQQLLIKSYLLSQIMTTVDASYLFDFTNRCLSLSGYELLVDHLVDLGLFQYLLANYSQRELKNEIETLFKLLIEFKTNKYSEIVKEMELPDELRVKLFSETQQLK